MSCGTLDSISYPSNGDFWSDQQVNVIGHHYEGMQDKIAQDRFTSPNRFNNRGGDSGIV